MFSDSFQSFDSSSWEKKTFYDTTPGTIGSLPNQYNASNVANDSSGMHITASKGVNEYISGWVDSVGLRSWTYGYFETKMRLPNVPGIWIGFFTVHAGGFPPEIDAGEVSQNLGYIQFQVRESVGVDWNYKPLFGPSLFGQWHRFAFDWEPGRVRWFIDDLEYWSTTHSPSTPMYMFYSFGMGEWQTPNDLLLPAVLDIEYLKIWQ